MIAAASALTTIVAIGWKVLDRFRFGDSFAISPHGIGIAVGFLAGAYVLVFEGRKRGVAEETSSALVFWALVGTIIGARGFYVLGHYSEFKGDVAEMLAVYKGGLTLIGGIAGAVIVSYPAMRRRKVGFLRIMDAAAIGLPLGIVIGRIGDLIIGDHIGKPTSWALAFQYHGGNLAGFDCSFAGRCIDTSLYGGHIEIITPAKATLQVGNTVVGSGIGVHQTALYDFLLAMALTLFVLWLNRRARRTGVLFMTFLIGYGMSRILEDLLRIDKRFFAFTGSQWTSLGAAVVGVAMLAWWALHPLPKGSSDQEEPPPTDDEAEPEAEPASSP